MAGRLAAVVWATRDARSGFDGSPPARRGCRVGEDAVRKEGVSAGSTEPSPTFESGMPGLYFHTFNTSAAAQAAANGGCRSMTRRRTTTSMTTRGWASGPTRTTPATTSRTTTSATATARPSCTRSATTRTSPTTPSWATPGATCRTTTRRASQPPPSHLQFGRGQQGRVGLLRPHRGLGQQAVAELGRHRSLPGLQPHLRLLG